MLKKKNKHTEIEILNNIKIINFFFKEISREVGEFSKIIVTV